MAPVRTDRSNSLFLLKSRKPGLSWNMENFEMSLRLQAMPEVRFTRPATGATVEQLNMIVEEFCCFPAACRNRSESVSHITPEPV